MFDNIISINSINTINIDSINGIIISISIKNIIIIVLIVHTYSSPPRTLDFSVRYQYADCGKHVGEPV